MTSERHALLAQQHDSFDDLREDVFVGIRYFLCLNVDLCINPRFGILVCGQEGFGSLACLLVVDFVCMVCQDTIFPLSFDEFGERGFDKNTESALGEVGI